MAHTAAYVRTPLSSAVALAAVSHLADRFAILLSEGRAYSEAKPVPTVTERGEELLFTENIDAHIQTWFPLLIGISSGITSTLGSVRSASTDALFHLLKVNGNKFSNGLWSLIYRGVLSPIFDDVRHLSGTFAPSFLERRRDSLSLPPPTALRGFVFAAFVMERLSSLAHMGAGF